MLGATLVWSCAVFIPVGVLVGQWLLWSSSWHWLTGYVELEFLSLAIAGSVLGVSSTLVLESASALLVSWSIVILLVGGVHVLMPLGLLGAMPFMLVYWLVMGGLSLGLLPLLGVGWSGLVHLMASVRSLGTGSLSGVSSCALREGAWSWLGNGSWLWLLGAWELGVMGSVWSGLWSLVNWAYQVVYFGCRLWLVFVLHAFCLGSFAELYSVGCDGVLLLSFPVGGLLGLALSLGCLMVGYLAIQLYVYVSFSLSFIHYTVLGWYSSGVSEVYAYTSVWLVPVCVVDVFSGGVWALGCALWTLWLVGARSSLWTRSVCSREIEGSLNGRVWLGL